MESFELLPHFVDDYLGYLYEVRPTAATLDGVHAHDDHIEDFSRASLDRQLRDLNGFARRLAGIRSDPANGTERLDRAMLDADIHARLFELDSVRTHERNPQLYADALATTLASQVMFDYASQAERGRRLVSKLRQTPALLAAARENVRDPVGLFVKTAIETLRGLIVFLDVDLPRAMADIDDLSLLGDLADASGEAGRAIGAYVEELETEVAPKARGSFRLGPERFAQKLRLEEGLDRPLDQVLAVAERELAATQEQFQRIAAKKGAADALEAWQALKREHPAAGTLVAEARAHVEALAEFVRQGRVASVPDHEPIKVAETPPFYRWTFASIWCPGPFETRATRAFYYLTDADPTWPPARQDEHLRDFNEPTLWAISTHEVYPGHYLHFQHLRRLSSKVRKSLLLMPASVVEGWAHYAEQVMVEAGFGGPGHPLVLGQLAEAMLRLARLIVVIRLHAGDWSVEQGVRFFKDAAYIEESSARREAERGTFDPAYGSYALGRLMILKLREDWRTAAGSRYSLKSFNDMVLGQGGLPIPLQREALLGARGTIL